MPFRGLPLEEAILLHAMSIKIRTLCMVKVFFAAPFAEEGLRVKSTDTPRCCSGKNQALPGGSRARPRDRCVGQALELPPFWGRSQSCPSSGRKGRKKSAAGRKEPRARGRGGSRGRRRKAIEERIVTCIGSIMIWSTLGTKFVY